MKLALSAEDQTFLEEARAFIDRHWPRSLRPAAANQARAAEPAQRAWCDALVARGWSVPRWPLEHGGTGWTSLQHYLWEREVALAEAPLPEGFAVSLLGPLLCAAGSADQQARFLAPIRELRMRWCQGYAEPDAGSDLASLATRAERSGDHYRVDGVKTWVSGADPNGWMLCLARTDPASSRAAPEQGLSCLLVDLSSAGIEIRSIPTFDPGAALSSVTLHDVRVPVANRLGDEGQGWDWVQALLARQRTLAARVAASRVRLERLKALAAERPRDGTALLEDADFRRRLADAEVAVYALEALELRAVGQADVGAAASVLKIRGAEVGQQISELLLESFGYHGLPCPDALLVDNEGAIGHDYALSALQGMLQSRSWSIDGGTSEVHKNIIAKTVLGF